MGLGFCDRPRARSRMAKSSTRFNVVIVWRIRPIICEWMRNSVKSFLGMNFHEIASRLGFSFFFFGDWNKQNKHKTEQMRNGAMRVQWNLVTIPWRAWYVVYGGFFPKSSTTIGHTIQYRTQKKKEKNIWEMTYVSFDCTCKIPKSAVEKNM